MTKRDIENEKSIKQDKKLTAFVNFITFKNNEYKENDNDDSQDSSEYKNNDFDNIKNIDFYKKNK